MSGCTIYAMLLTNASGFRCLDSLRFQDLTQESEDIKVSFSDSSYTVDPKVREFIVYYLDGKFFEAGGNLQVWSRVHIPAFTPNTSFPVLHSPKSALLTFYLPPSSTPRANPANSKAISILRSSRRCGDENLRRNLPLGLVRRRRGYEACDEEQFEEHCPRRPETCQEACEVWTPEI
ncbi:hypothetical protein PM082_008925 [Marasmius tenuissimus]|nr:hypothetical protein PM082_008925 [Marasmius tenuissimus]